MINKVIESLLKPKYTGYNIYVHNLAYFDGIFLLKNLSSGLSSFKDKEYNLNYINTKLIPIMREDKMISLKLLKIEMILLFIILILIVFILKNYWKIFILN